MVTDDITETVRSRLIQLVDARENNDIDFERKMGLRPRTYADWKQKKGNAFLKILPQIAKEYDVSVDWLMGNDYVAPDMREVKIIGRIHCGAPIESFEVSEGTVKLPMDMAPVGRLFALNVVGDSMLPLVAEGDIIICSKTIPRDVNNKICVVTFNSESALKRLRRVDDGLDLIPVNPMYPVLHISHDTADASGFRIDGVLVQSIRKFNGY